MARRKKGSKGKKKLPLAVVIPAALPFITSGARVMGGSSIGTEARSVMAAYTGIMENGSFVPMHAINNTYIPLAVGIVAHKTVGKYANRYLPKWVPFSI